MHYPNKENLYISRLPSLKEFKKFRSLANVQHWINVSGIDIHEIFPGPALLGYNFSQFDFADIFTDGEKLSDFSGLEQFDSQCYLNVSELEHRNAFLAAVKMLILQLENGCATSIFCHRGQARSPLVAAAALNNKYNESFAQSIARVQQIHPPAYFTDISISALLWCKEQLHKPVFTG